MAIQFSVTVRNGRLDNVETTIGVSALLKIYTGAMPVNCAAATTGTLLASQSLPSDWMSNAASGSKAMLGTWSATASATGTAGYFRIFDSTGTTCHIQGTCTATGGGGDLTATSATITNGDTVTVTGFTITDANA